jgi:hypothetical protein
MIRSRAEDVGGIRAGEPRAASARRSEGQQTSRSSRRIPSMVSLNPE